MLFNCAEEDPIFAKGFAEQVEKEWRQGEGEGGRKYKFNYYENTVHGFAARPNLADEKVKAAFEKAFSEGVDWWKAHL